MLPLNDVVLENYWTNKEDVQSVVNSCYAGLMENGYITNLIVWGETRSDNVLAGPDIDKNANLKNLLKGNLKTTNSYCDWSAMYKVINRCNTVIYYAPQVEKEDPNYTKSLLDGNIAECKALRAMSYLTLAKTFKNVPYCTEPSIDDSQQYRRPAIPFADVIDSLIKDVEPYKDAAPLKNIAADGCTIAEQSTGKITRAAMYSLLAELYLWKASDANRDRSTQMEAYRECIRYCDWVLNYKAEQYRTNQFGDGKLDLTKYVDKEVLTKYGFPLLAEEAGSTFSPNTCAFTQIFGQGNSFESIFEITYMHTSSESYAKNTEVGLMYGGYKDKMAQAETVYLVASEDLLSNSSDLTNNYSDLHPFTSKSDYRTLLPFQYADGGTFAIRKYVERYAASDGKVGSTWLKTSDNVSYRSFLSNYANWIVYRLTEIMLFRAEAEIELAGLMQAAMSENATDDDNATDSDNAGDDENAGSDNTEGTSAKQRKAISQGSALGTPDELYQDAFDLISAVYLRSNPAVKNSANFAPNISNYKTLSDFETLLMNERRREFLFEGKRYFDLVRQARRDGNTQRFRGALTSKYSGAGKAVTSKMIMMDFMYMPYLKTQVQVNPTLVQNSAFEDEEESVKN